MPKITKRMVDALTPDPERDIQVMDSELVGFGVRMKPTGAASYFVRYRTPEGTARRLALGKVGALTPDEARKLARVKLAEVAKGSDPSAERRKVREASTVAEVCDWYLDAALRGDIRGREGKRIKPSTLAMDQSRIDCHILPLIGRRSVDSLTDTDIARLQRDIAAGKTAKARAPGPGGITTGGEGVAARTVRMLRAILAHAERGKLIRSNPARGVRILAEGKRERRLSEEEIRALGVALQSGAEADENNAALGAVRFLLMTGLRRMEALSLRWADVDLKGRCVCLRDSKSGAQVRAVGAAAFAVLDELTRVPGIEWVFPATRGKGHFVGLPKVLDRVFAAAGIEGASAHTLRHTFASVAGDLGFSEMTVAALLGHARKGVTQRYVKVDRAAVLAADAVASHIAGLLDGVGAEDAKVLVFPKAG
jgi:integrase